MNLQFPLLLPPLIDPKWFNADSPCDEDAELTRLEQENKRSLNSIGQQYMKRLPIGKKIDPPPMQEEVYTVEEGNEESDESEESQEDEEEEDLITPYTPPRDNNESAPDSLDDVNDSSELDLSDQSALWPGQ
ncbi:anaphase-promoting complex subunit 15B-like isoform X2 [Battus philenor]|uniref:anaphase-promoting complex subunit 15B-like isoform X2 n=1 Tax=Battus philenor TaxID=42288 RepID=UPI0035CFE933